jgi:UDP-arabinose 4-epimerase
MRRILFLVSASLQLILCAENKGNVLVTGGAGYIGSHTCKALAKEGYTPIVFDNLIHKQLGTVKWGPFIRGDINDKEALRKAFSQYHPIAVIHFAALIQVGESVKDPDPYYRTNVMGTLSLLEVMRESGVSNLIFSSSAATYGIPEQVPIEETHPQFPINPYGNTKLISEMMIKDFAEAYGIHFIIFRYFNAAGADLEGELGFHDRPSHLIPLAMQVAAGVRPHLEIYGTDYPTRDGTGVRDYIHVVDLAQAHVLGVTHLLQKNTDLILNLGTGKGFSVNEIVQTIEKITGKSIHVKHAPRRAGDPAEIICEATKSQQLLGWRAQHSDVKTLISSSWQWQQKRLKEGS